MRLDEKHFELTTRAMIRADGIKPVLGRVEDDESFAVAMTALAFLTADVLRSRKSRFDMTDIEAMLDLHLEGITKELREDRPLDS